MTMYKYHVFLKFQMVLLTLTCSISLNSYAGEYFAPELLMLGSGEKERYTNEDLAIFEKSDIPPGVYDLDIYLNKRKLEHKSVELFLLKNEIGKDLLVPCLTQSELTAYGIKLSNNFLTETVNNGCVDLSIIPYLKTEIDLETLSIKIAVPQANIDESRLVNFEKKFWDNGIPALLLGYDFSQFSARQDGKTKENYYGNIRANINIGAWRYENYSVLTKNSGENTDWNTISNTLSTIIKPINSDLTMGNTYTSSSMFDTVKIKGAKLSSNLQMLPSAYRTYAPNVQGLADSESVVTITQNGNVIYRKSLPAGPFNITDYYPMGSGGNLNVNVTGTDGQQKNFIVPFSSMGVFERKGNYQYSFASGKYDSSGDRDGTYLNQLNFHYGLTNFVTLSAGAQISSPYKAYALGTGLNMGSFGAASLDMVHAQTKTLSRSFNGNSFKVNYSKNILPTNTNLTIVGYKHFDDQYYGFNEAMALDDNFDRDVSKLKTEYTASINQTLPKKWGQLNLSSTVYNYRNGQDNTTINMGYSNSYNQISYSLYYNYNKGQKFGYVDDLKEDSDYSLGLSVSFPLDYGRIKNPIYAGYSVSTNKENYTVQNLNVNGSSGERQQISWGVYQGYDHKGNDYSGGLSGTYQAPFANMRAGYSYNGDLKNTNLGISGGVVASKYGLLFSQPLQGTNALVVVDNAKGVQVQNSISAITNNAGVALVSGLQPYRANTITLNNGTIPEDIEIENTVINNIMPTQGALILANFTTEVGYKLLLKVTDEAGREVPFGAQASVNQGRPAIISNFGQLYMLTHQKKGNIQVQWTRDAHKESCEISFDLEKAKVVNGLYMMPVVCRDNTQSIVLNSGT